MSEWWVVSEWAWMNETGHGIDRCLWGIQPTLVAAKRWGLREFGHDDFTLAEVRDGVTPHDAVRFKSKPVTTMIEVDE